MGSPSQLSVAQVKRLKQLDADIPIAQSTVTVNASGNFEKQLNIRQNDVLLVKIKKAD